MYLLRLKAFPSTILINIYMFIDNLTAFIKENKLDEKIINDLQQTLRTSRWNKPNLVCYFRFL